jgi:hypothetical protein
MCSFQLTEHVELHVEKKCAQQTMVMKFAQMEHEMEKLQAEKKMLVKKHLEEMKARDLKEFRLFSVLCICVMVYACLSLITRVIV